ncbi:hypothetical protein [Actinomadura sp. SCN-SB]|uniref:hypothetical protein n=1 Tax=Actinomadura sp. SCN-SB TaxID=3373092 RepID=UPI0037510F0B
MIVRSADNRPEITGPERPGALPRRGYTLKVFEPEAYPDTYCDFPVARRSLTGRRRPGSPGDGTRVGGGAAAPGRRAA